MTSWIKTCWKVCIDDLLFSLTLSELVKYHDKLSENLTFYKLTKDTSWFELKFCLQRLVSPDE